MEQKRCWRKGKIAHASRKGALKQLRSLKSTDFNRNVVPYKGECYICPFCRMWHVGRQKPQE